MKKILYYGLPAAALLVAALFLAANFLVDAPAATAQEGVEIPFLDDWSGSGHADASAVAFNYWNEADPKEIPTNCAKCHSTPGYLDFIGADGSAAGAVDKAAPTGTTVQCTACHNSVTLTMDSVVMPSGLEITDLGREARCMQCHQGRESTVSVNKVLDEAAAADDDTVSDKLGFRNVHYFAAAATKYGTAAKGGYEYEGKSYDGNFAHVTEYDTCIECHNVHTLEVKVQECAACHTDVKTVDDLKDVRMAGSLVDYDGDGNTTEGVYFELEGLREMLYEGIQAYASEVAGKDVAYDSASHPYFFIDTNGNGSADTAEVNGDNRFNAWTPRLLKAAYNYQVSTKDPGAFAHGGKYIIELVYDSIEDLNTALAKPVDLSDAHRIDHGHFAGSEAAFRRWDAEGEVPGTCSKCHSSVGLPVFLKDNASVSQHTANGFLCATCHQSISEDEEAPRYEVTKVEFPSGLVIDAESADANTLLCMNCHQGRESTVSVNTLIEGLDPNIVSEKLRFLNVHYFAAGATRYGTQAKGAYEYTGQQYNGLFVHPGDGEEFGCADCHNAHTQQVQLDTCTECHEGITDQESLQTIRASEVDFDGDGNATEGIAGEVSTMHEALYKAMQAYATKTAQSAIAYESHSYPYFFIDTNKNGTADPAEAVRENGFKAWTPKLLQAAYNYQYAAKDPGAFAHNPEYIIQTLYDSLKDVGGDVSKMKRPAVR
jgi:hypothetical protein